MLSSFRLVDHDARVKKRLFSFERENEEISYAKSRRSEHASTMKTI